MLILAYTWAPIVWREGRRSINNFGSSDYLALDFENHEFQLPDAKRAFAGMTHVIGTTRNHQKWKGDIPPMDRFRVLVPWNRPITDASTYTHNVAIACRMYGADKACVDAAHLFFPCNEIVAIEYGEAWDVIDAPKTSAIVRSPPRVRKPRPGWLSRKARYWIEQEIPPGMRSNTLFKLGAELARCLIALDEALYLTSNSVTIRKISHDRHEVAMLLSSMANGHKRQTTDDAAKKK